MAKVIGSVALFVVASTVGICSVACGTSSDDTVKGTNDLSAGGSTPIAPANPPAGATTTAPSAPSTAAPPASAATVLLDCKDMEESTSGAHLTVDSAFNFSWDIGETNNSHAVTGTLVSVMGPTTDNPSYNLQATDGHIITLDATDLIISMSGLDAQCDPTTAKFDKAALDNLVQLTAASMAKQQPFATCQLDDGDTSHAPKNWTVRPALGGPGALIEGDFGDESFVLFTTSIASSAPGVTVYSGAGGTLMFAAGQHTSDFKKLTGTAGNGSTTFTWDAGEQIPTNTCRVTGLDYAKSLGGSK
jgi:hypothetical protein